MTAHVVSGDLVAAGGLLGRLHNLERPGDPSTPVLAPTVAAAAGGGGGEEEGGTSTGTEGTYVMGVRTVVPSRPGDALCWTGREISLDALWANSF